MIANKPKMIGTLLAVILILAAAAGCVPSGIGGSFGEGTAPNEEGGGLTASGGDELNKPAADEGEPADLFAASSGNIHDYMPGLLAGRAVSDYDLLPCLENFTHATWLELGEVYGREWWNPLWEALHSAAVSGGRSQRDFAEQSRRNYYLGKALLTSDGAYTEGLTVIQALQWDYDKALYSACLSEYFTEEEATGLRQFLLYSLSYGDSIFGLHIPGAGGALCLNTYPLDFPFGFDLAEQGREGFRVESFGPGAVVEGDGLQVTYLNPSEGVYTVITIRATHKGCSAAGVAIGDTEEALLEKWRDKSLKKLSSISYDSEAWFSKCNLAYAHTPGEGTKSVVYLIRDGLVDGIELADGLDGPIY